MFLTPMRSFAVDGEKSHAGPERSRHSFSIHVMSALYTQGSRKPIKLSFKSPIGDSCFCCKQSWHSRHTGSSQKRQRVLAALQLLLHLWSSGQQRSGISCRISSTSGWCGSSGSFFSFSSSSLAICSSDQRSCQSGKSAFFDVAYRSVKVCCEKFLWRLPHVIYVGSSALFPLPCNLRLKVSMAQTRIAPFGANPSRRRAALPAEGGMASSRGGP